jgi:FAD/FMN-containing dehydrogenase
VKGLAVILKDGLERELERGQFVFGPRGLPLPFGGFLDAEPGHLGLPPGADLLDLLIGGQGMYGYVSGLWLGLKKAPKSVWALVFFLDDEKKAAHLIEKTLADDLAALVSLDFLDAASLGVIAELGKSAKKLSQIPQTPAGAKAAVMVELMAEGEYLIEKDSGKILENCQEVGGDPDASWALVGSEAEKARIFRHAVPEGLGGKIDAIRAGGYLATKTAGDFTRPDLSFGQALFECRRDLKEAALEAAIFGHAHSSHLHVNFLPTDGAQTKRALELMGHWLELAKMAGGELFFEQGVGKLKKELFLAHERPQRILALKKVKKALDPQGLFNPHNLFD